jgi:hypothetical protein
MFKILEFIIKPLLRYKHIDFLFWCVLECPARLCNTLSQSRITAKMVNKQNVEFCHGNIVYRPDRENIILVILLRRPLHERNKLLVNW